MNSLRTSLLFAAAAIRVASGAPLSVDPASVHVEVDVRATAHAFTARVTAPELEIEGDAGGERITGARLRFRWESLKTGNLERDVELSKWAEAADQPFVTFVLTSIDRTADQPVAHGRLAMHGREIAVSFPFEIDERADGTRRLSGSLTLDHRDWGLPRIRRMLFLSVNPVVTARFALEVRLP